MDNHYNRIRAKNDFLIDSGDPKGNRIMNVRACARLHRAVKQGQVTKPTACENCGKQAQLEGHHEDYKQPLTVIWLCKACHYERQNAIKRLNKVRQTKEQQAVKAV